MPHHGRSNGLFLYRSYVPAPVDEACLWCAGLVGITSACSVVEHYGAVIIGAIAGIIMLASSKLLKRIRIDDPLDSVSVHFSCGIW